MGPNVPFWLDVGNINFVLMLSYVGPVLGLCWATYRGRVQKTLQTAVAILA